MSAWTVQWCLRTCQMKTPHLLSTYYAWLVWNSMLGHVWLNFTIRQNRHKICKLSFWCAHPGMQNVVGPEWWLQCIGYQRPYGDPCGSDVLPGGDSNTQYAPYCGNQCPLRLLIGCYSTFYGCGVMSMRRQWWFCPRSTLQHMAWP